ncbi:MAG: hypothetical protein L6R38_009606 [Xanthoria sp. 2 TBL-2021]|nr:MAG: hypothetical protein L6R38_009606 [Xanthoria sp. 2 TBL-2021]
MDQTNWKKLYPGEPVLISSLKAGALSGASGLVIGGVAGIVRSSTPGLFAIASGLQCAALGTTYYATRGAILQAWQVTASSPPQDRIYPSTIAGGITGGTVGGLTRGRANIVPGMIMFSLFGFAGQYVYNALDARHHNSHGAIPTATTQTKPTSKSDHGSIGAQDAKPEEPLWKRVLNSKWSPMKVLSDEQYEKMLREKLLRVEAELAIVDEDIEKVKQREEKARKGGKDGTD